MMLRYLCSFLSGWILWADVVNDAPYMQEVIGAYIPALANVTGTTLAIIYSLVYNGVYMIPEIVLTCVVGFLLVQFAGKQILDKAPEPPVSIRRPYSTCGNRRSRRPRAAMAGWGFPWSPHSTLRCSQMEC